MKTLYRINLCITVRIGQADTWESLAMAIVILLVILGDVLNIFYKL